MKYAKIKNGIVIQTQPSDQNGFVEVGDEITCGMLYDGSVFLAPLIAVDKALSAKRALRESLSSLAHDFGDGRVIQVRHPDYAADAFNIDTAIDTMERGGEESRLWIMQDNQMHMVTLDELKVAKISGQDQGDAIWDEFFAAVGGV